MSSGDRCISLVDVLADYGTTEDELVSEASTRQSLMPGDILFLSGSLVEGLGNRSDVDAYVITGRALSGHLGRRNTAFELKGLVVDVELISLDELEDLLRRFESWSTGACNVSRAFSFWEWDFLHRIASGRARLGAAQFAAIQRRAPLEMLARFKLD